MRVCENKIWNLSPMKHQVFSSESSGPAKFWILSKLHELCKSFRRNPLENLEWKIFQHWRTMYLWICYFPPFISHSLTLSWRRSLSYRKQSIDLLSKSVDWFLYDNGLRHDRVKYTLIHSSKFLAYLFHIRFI